MAQIAFQNISLSFGIVVEDFNLLINEGEIVTFFGPSGCGKSSIMKLVLGINVPTKGTVKIGSIIAGQYKRAISYVPQDNELLPWLTVKANIEVWSERSANDSFSTSEVLKMVDLHNHAEKLPSMLSGGMARRTALARGLATKSEVLCFDEAMVGIEKTMRYKLLTSMRSYIKNTNATAIFISHDYEETILLSDKIIVFSAPPTSILKTIDVSNLISGLQRDNLFLASFKFKEIYNQMLITC